MMHFVIELSPGIFLFDNLQDTFNSRSVCRAFGYVMQSHHARRIDKHITTSLINIIASWSGTISFEDLLEIYPPGGWPPQIPKACLSHAIITI